MAPETVYEQDFLDCSYGSRCVDLRTFGEFVTARARLAWNRARPSPGFHERRHKVVVAKCSSQTPRKWVATPHRLLLNAQT